jgi:thioredoxin 1
MKPIEVTEATFQSEVAQSDQPVLVDFWAPWCGPCRLMAPVLDEIAAEHGDRFKIAKVNVDENPILAASFAVHSIPTLAFVKDGKLRDQVIGGLNKKALIARLEALAA